MSAKTKIIEVRAIEHNKQSRLALYFQIDKELIALVKTLPDAYWSQSQKCWHIANNRTNLKELFRVFKGIAYVNANALFLPKPKQEKPIEIKEKIILNNQLTSEHLKKNCTVYRLAKQQTLLPQHCKNLYRCLTHVVKILP
jgi:hypothetical protein